VTEGRARAAFVRFGHRLPRHSTALSAPDAIRRDSIWRFAN